VRTLTLPVVDSAS